MQVAYNDIAITPRAVNIRHLIQKLKGVTQTTASVFVS